MISARRLAASWLATAAVLAATLPLAGAAAAADPGPTAVTVTRTTPAVGGASMTFTPAFTPAFPDGYAFPATTICSWELRWGDEASILHNDYDKTFGSLLLRGKGSDGYCSPWTFTLPYSAAGLWQFAFSYSDADGGYANTPYTLIHGSNAAAAGGIDDSNLPGVWVSLPNGAHQGDTVTSIAHPFGGYVLPAGGTHWDAYGPCDCKPFASASNHALSFSFTASVPGTITVFYNDAGHPEDGGPNFAGAGIDPKVIDVRVVSSVPSAPHAHTNVSVSASGKGFVGAVTYTWYVNDHLRFTGRTGNMRFKHAGWRTIRVVARDAHGHHAAHNERRYVRP